MRLVLSDDAKTDLKNIYRHIANTNSKRIAEKYLGELNTVTILLIDHPLLGKERPDVGKSMRFLPIKSHLLFYYVSDDVVFISRVLHSAADYIQILKEEGRSP